jgi:uncharacterized membrane protein YhhN
MLTSPLTLPVIVTLVTVAALIRAISTGDTRGVYVFKPCSTLLIVLICLLSLAKPGVDPAYTLLIVFALLCSLGGDIALMFDSEPAFLTGLILFLIVQITYGGTFAWFNGLIWPGTAFLLAALAACSAAAYAALYPGLGKMKVPVGGYVLIITLMVWQAAATLFGAAFSPAQAVLITAGAFLFYLSDIILAFYKFKTPRRWQMPLNFATYYAAQLLIALSASFF